MALRSDQSPPRTRPADLQSHQFALQRAVGALAMRDPDPVSSPMRRIGGALFAGVMIALLAIAAVGVYGMLRPGTGGAWRDGRAIIIERESGARFVYVEGVLHPVLNHTSAMLILGTGATVQVARADLLDVPRGTPVGIPGAPDPLPAQDHLVAGAWTLCSRPPTAPTTDPDPAESVLRVGWVPADAPLAGGVLAADPSGGRHLLWDGRRYALPEPTLVTSAFAWSEEPVTVATALLNAVSAGPDLVPVSTPRSAAPSAVPGLHVGEVFVATNTDGGHRYGVALGEGVLELTAVQASLLVADGANGGADARPLALADLAAAPRLGSLIPSGDDAPPADPPVQVRPGLRDGICATFAPGSSLPSLTVTGALAPLPGEAATTAGGIAEHADHIAVPPGRGVLVESLATSTAAGGSLAVVTDLGLRFAVPSVQVLGMLGYGGATPLRLPASLVALVPPGRALDPAAAILPATTA